MEAIILAGGKGTRLQSVVSDVPKPMANINNRPFLDYILEFLREQNVKKFLLSVGYKSDVIIKHYNNSYKGIPIEYVIEESQLGTGGAVRQALYQSESNDVLVVNGDTLFKAPHSILWHTHYRTNSLFTMALTPINSDGRFWGSSNR